MNAYLEDLINRSRDSFKLLKGSTTLKRNQALTKIAQALEQNADRILAANQIDVAAAKASGVAA